MFGILQSKTTWLSDGGIFLPTVWKMMYLVLLTLTDILLDMNQEAHFFSSVLTLSISSGRFLPLARPWVSSANRYVKSLEELGRSLMKHRKSMGPSIVPWSTDMSISCGFERMPSSETHWVLPER